MLTAIGDVMRKCYDRGWITTRDGNISLVKKGCSAFYITPSGVRKSIIHPEHIVRLPIQDGEIVLKEGQNPSGELEMHWLLQKDYLKTRAIVHVHATNVVAAMYAGWDLQKIAAEFPEISRYTRVGPSVPSLPAVSKELAIATNEAFRVEGKISYDIVGQANHGVTSIARDPWTAYEHVERLDHICEIILKSGRKP